MVSKANEIRRHGNKNSVVGDGEEARGEAGGGGGREGGWEAVESGNNGGRGGAGAEVTTKTRGKESVSERSRHLHYTYQNRRMRVPFVRRRCQ